MDDIHTFKEQTNNKHHYNNNANGDAEAEKQRKNRDKELDLILLLWNTRIDTDLPHPLATSPCECSQSVFFFFSSSACLLFCIFFFSLSKPIFTHIDYASDAYPPSFLFLFYGFHSVVLSLFSLKMLFFGFNRNPRQLNSDCKTNV